MSVKADLRGSIERDDRAPEVGDGHHDPRARQRQPRQPERDRHGRLDGDDAFLRPRADELAEIRDQRREVPHRRAHVVDHLDELGRGACARSVRTRVLEELLRQRDVGRERRERAPEIVADTAEEGAAELREGAVVGERHDRRSRGGTRVGAERSSSTSPPSLRRFLSFSTSVVRLMRRISAARFLFQPARSSA